ncbi:hypothetical protein [Streptomyces tibetensis]|uniref:hypothetical protein n=1 Tax=Streptomyces tibetensis TaxID=2382123 RepID=UPI0033EAB622
MSRLRAAERIRGVKERISRRTEHIVNTIRSGCSAVDIWIQDHYRFTVISMLLTLATGTALLLRWRWDEVIDVAKQIAPVFTIVSILASALLSVLAWFRKRRQRRLAAQETPVQRQPSANGQ